MKRTFRRLLDEVAAKSLELRHGTAVWILRFVVERMVSERLAARFGDWGIIELMGHRVVAGEYRYHRFAGSGFVSIRTWDPDEQKYYYHVVNPKAVFCITPCDEEIARAHVESHGGVPFVIGEIRHDIEYREYKARQKAEDPEDLDEIPF
jgi:hypothetical protein